MGDYRRKLVTERPAWTTSIENFTFEEVPGLGSGIISFESPFTILAGPNGVGKSTLARCIFATLNGRAGSSLSDPRTGSGVIRISGSIEGQAFERELNLGSPVDAEDELGIAIEYVDCGRSALSLQAELSKFGSVDELTNGVSGIDLGPTDLAAVSRIVCRDYRSVRLYEVELDEIRPFFEVAYGPGTYNSQTMGDGELSGLLLWWQFWRASKNSIIVLEEPETFLSVGSQKASCEFILSMIVQKRLVCVLSSHSAGFIENIAEDGLRFFARNEDGIIVIEGDPPPVTLKSVGMKFERVGHAFVEDSAAEGFLRNILERFNPALSRKIGVSVSGGDGEVRLDYEKFNSLGLRLKGIAVFDGDIDDAAILDGCFKLPGAQPIESLLRECATLKVDRLIELSGLSDLAIILHGLEGEDHHDWFEDFAKEGGLNKGAAFNLLFRLWIEDEANEKAAADVVKSIQEFIDAHP